MCFDQPRTYFMNTFKLYDNGIKSNNGILKE